MIKRIIYLMFAAGIMLSACKNNGNVAQTASGEEETETVTTASAETAQSVSLATDSLVKPKGILPYPEEDYIREYDEYLRWREESSKVQEF
ncbi:MAG: hypothetical protein II157_04950, partial [Bacteroidales bacterium]|nr:hypothetical protein [Bacteroidales bacterium]